MGRDYTAIASPKIYIIEMKDPYPALRERRTNQR
jgi:hypothetical protein